MNRKQRSYTGSRFPKQEVRRSPNGLVFLRPMTFPGQRANTGSIDTYPAPTHFVMLLRQCANVRLRGLTLRVPVLVVDAAAAALKRRRAATARLVKVLFDVFCGDGFNFGQNSHGVPLDVHRLAFVRHPMTLAVTHRIFPAITSMLGVTFLSGFVSRHDTAIGSTAHEVVG